MDPVIYALLRNEVENVIRHQAHVVFYLFVTPENGGVKYKQCKELWDIYCCKHIIVAPACRDFAQKSRDPEEARLAQLEGRRSAEREVAGSNPGRTNTQGYSVTENKVLPL